MPITLHSMRPFTARPVILAASDEKRATFRSATCNYQYIVRALAGQDVCGMTPDFSTRLDELIMSGRAAPRRADTGTLVGQRLWQSACCFCCLDRAGKAGSPATICPMSGGTGRA